MTNTNLMIAITFGSFFGLCVTCCGLWCINCYIHRHRLDLSQYFHTWTVNPAQPNSAMCGEDHCSRAKKSTRGRRPERLQTQRDYGYQDYEQRRIRDRNMDMRLIMQPNTPVQAHYEADRQPYRPSLKRKDRMQDMQPMMQQPIPIHWQPQGTLHASPFAPHPEISHQPSRQMATRIFKPFQGLPRYQPQELSSYRQPHEESVGSEASGAHSQRFPIRSKSPAERASRVRRVDYIHICDEYPPIVLEALKKAAPASPTASSSASSSSSSSDGSGTTQEIPRTDLASNMPDYVMKSPIQFPRYCHVARDSSRVYPGQ